MSQNAFIQIQYKRTDAQTKVIFGRRHENIIITKRKMEAKRPIWLEEFLIPFIVNKEKVKLQQRQSVNDVQLKSFEVKEFSSEGVLFTICYTIKIILDVDGRKRPLAVFVKVNAIEFVVTVFNITLNCRLRQN